jgi:hypothetical protein
MGKRVRVGGKREAEIPPENQQQICPEGINAVFCQRSEDDLVALLSDYGRASDPLARIKEILGPTRAIAFNNEFTALGANLTRSLAMCAVYFVAGENAYWEVRTWLWPGKCGHTVTNYQQTALMLAATVAKDESPAIKALFDRITGQGGQSQVDPKALLETAGSILRTAGGIWIPNYPIRKCLKYVMGKGLTTHNGVRDHLHLSTPKPRTFGNELSAIDKRYKAAAPQQQAEMRKQFEQTLPQFTTGPRVAAETAPPPNAAQPPQPGAPEPAPSATSPGLKWDDLIVAGGQFLEATPPTDRLARLKELHSLDVAVDQGQRFRLLCDEAKDALLALPAAERIAAAEPLRQFLEILLSDNASPIAEQGSLRTNTPSAPPSVESSNKETISLTSSVPADNLDSQALPNEQTGEPRKERPFQECHPDCQYDCHGCHLVIHNECIGAVN